MDTRIKKDDIAGCYAPTDYYYVDLYSDWNTNQNGKYGESKHFTKSGNEGGFETDIYVGRIPAKNIKDLKTVFKKIKDFTEWTSYAPPLFIGMTDTEPDPVDDAVALARILKERALNGRQLKALIEDDGSLDYISAKKNLSGFWSKRYEGEISQTVLVCL